MSHFFTVVLVQDTEPDDPNRDSILEGRVENLLACYNEDIQVDAYEEDCYCVGQEARRESQEKALQEMEIGDTIADYREWFWSLKVDERPDWDDFLGALSTLQSKYLQERDDIDSPNPECDSCHGTGIRMTTYNPLSKWDWWVIGGRWDGAIQGEYRESHDHGFNFGEEHHQIEYNSIPVEKLPEEFYPFAIVTPDGVWHEKGEMGWFGMATNEQQDSVWLDEVRSIIEQYKNRRIVAIGCDLHI